MSDYLVEVSRGRELLYQTPSALRAAMRSGEISPDSRIFHRTSSSWVSITVHPEFKKVAAARESEPLPPLARSRWTFFGVETDGRVIEEPQATETKAADVPAESGKRHQGLRGLLGRAFRGRAPLSSASEPASS
jgi:hypothetical protein